MYSDLLLRQRQWRRRQTPPDGFGRAVSVARRFPFSGGGAVVRACVLRRGTAGTHAGRPAIRRIAFYGHVAFVPCDWLAGVVRARARWKTKVDIFPLTPQRIIIGLTSRHGV